jgi:hypothetical protein
MKRSDKHIDRIIKDSLNKIEINKVNVDWQKLFSRYSGLSEKQTRIDKNLKDSLDKSEITFNPDTVWKGLILSVKTRKKRKNRLWGLTFILIAIICSLGIFYSSRQNYETAVKPESRENQIIKKGEKITHTSINKGNTNDDNGIDRSIKQQSGTFAEKTGGSEVINQKVKSENSDVQADLNKTQNKTNQQKTNENSGQQIMKTEDIQPVIPPVLLKSDKIVLKPTNESSDTQKILPPVIPVTDGNSTNPAKEKIRPLTITPSATSNPDSILKPSDSTYQNNKVPHKSKNSGLKVGITFYPAYNLNSTSVNSSKSDMVHKDFNLINNESIKPGFGYSFGLILGYGFLNLNLKTQVDYTKINLNTDYNYKNENIPVIDSATGKIISYIYKPDSNGIVMKSAISYSYIEIPLILGYEYSINSKWGIRTDIGVYYLLQLDSKGSMLNYSNLQLTSSGNNGKYPMNKSAYGWSFGLGVVYKTKFLDYTVEPVYKRTISSVYTNDIPVSDYITTLGLNISVAAKLKDIKNIFGIGKVNNQ